MDKNPLTLKDAGKLADEYTIIHKAYTTQKPYYRTAMRVEVTNYDKRENKYSGKKMNIKMEQYKTINILQMLKPGKNLVFM